MYNIKMTGWLTLDSCVSVIWSRDCSSSLSSASGDTSTARGVLLLLAGGFNPLLLAGGFDPLLLAGGFNPLLLAGVFDPLLLAGVFDPLLPVGWIFPPARARRSYTQGQNTI